MKTILAVFFFSSCLLAGPIDVAYTISGNPGDWTLSFDVTNNLSATPYQNLYYFGLSLDPGSLGATSGPATGGWSAGVENSGGINPHISYNVGPDIYFNVHWTGGDIFTGVEDPVTGQLEEFTALPGMTTSSFTVTITDSGAPALVDWLAFTNDACFSGNDCYVPSLYFSGDIPDNTGYNPGFLGVATAADAAAPEPSTFSSLLAGLIGVVVVGRRLRADR